MKTLLLACLLAVALPACSPDTPKIAETPRNEMDKAKGVQDTLNQGAERENQEIEKQSE